MSGKKIIINEVGPRDGFQNVEDFIETDVKLHIIDSLIESGIKNIQVTSFVNPKAVPQMADAKKIADVCISKYCNSDVLLYALVPNRRGAELAVESGFNVISYVTSASESHNMANVRKTVNQSVEELKQMVLAYPDIQIIWDVAMAFGCAFEGPLSDDHILRHIHKGADAGVRQFNLCDSCGMATPDMLEERIRKILDEFPQCSFRIHVHDTRNMGMLNTYTAIQCGINSVETSVGGLGGCPFSPGATGNTSTEDLVYMLNSMGYETGIDFDRLLETAKYVKTAVNGNFSGHQIFINKKLKCQ